MSLLSTFTYLSNSSDMNHRYLLQKHRNATAVNIYLPIKFIRHEPQVLATAAQKCHCCLSRPPDINILWFWLLTLLHSERPKLYTILAFLDAIGLGNRNVTVVNNNVTYLSCPTDINLRYCYRSINNCHCVNLYLSV